MSNPAYKHGKYSRFLGGALGDAYQRARADPAYGSLRERIAVNDAQFELLLSQLTAETRKQAEEINIAAVRSIQIALADNQEERRRLTETEGKNIERLQQTITQDQARQLMARLVLIIGEEVKEREVLRRIARRVQVELADGTQWEVGDGRGANSNDAAETTR